jgi:hypothetical protein
MNTHVTTSQQTRFESKNEEEEIHTVIHGGVDGLSLLKQALNIDRLNNISTHTQNKASTKNSISTWKQGNTNSSMKTNINLDWKGWFQRLSYSTNHKSTEDANKQINQKGEVMIPWG